MSAALAFDLLIIAALVWSAARALTVADLFRGVVLFIVFGLLMALASARPTSRSPKRRSVPG